MGFYDLTKSERHKIIKEIENEILLALDLCSKSDKDRNMVPEII